MNPLLFGADFHLDARLYGLAIIEDDYQRGFQTFFDSALSLPNTNMVLLGDVCNISFERRRVLKRIREAVEAAGKAGRTTYYISGNHDKDEVSLAEAVGLPYFVDAERAFYDALNAGKAFQPYGPDGPKVAAFHWSGADELWAKLRAVREKETPANTSTELWLHQAIRPGARVRFAEFDAVDFVNSGWHTILAGDIHNGGMWAVQGTSTTGLLAYPGSPEMTDINEPQRTRGFVLHRPVDAEAAANIEAFSQVPYLNRPYDTFDFEGQRTAEQVSQVLTWIRDVTAKTGMKPIVRVRAPDATWRNDPEILPYVIKMMYARPETDQTAMVETAPAVLLPDGSVAGGNAERYGTVNGHGTLLEKLAHVLDQANLTDEERELGRIVLLNPSNPELWMSTAYKQPRRQAG